MPINIISNGALSYLNQVNKKRNASDDYYHDLDEEFGIGPAYIVEISARGRRLLQENPVRKIVRL